MATSPPNPVRKPTRRPLSQAYRDVLNSVMPDAMRNRMKHLDLPLGCTWAEGIARARAIEAMGKGGTNAAKELREGTQGKAAIEAILASDRKVEINFIYTDAEVKNPKALASRNGDGEGLGIESSVIDVIPLNAKPVAAIATTPKKKYTMADWPGLEKDADGEFCPWPRVGSEIFRCEQHGLVFSSEKEHNDHLKSAHK
jgi:hypothetical protein